MEEVNYAHFWPRLGAHLIDFILVNAVSFGIEYGVTLLLGLSSFEEQIFGGVVAIAISYWYYCRYQVNTGTTFGKKVFSIYVVDEPSGAFLSSRQALIRFFGYIPSYALLGCGFLMAAFHPQKKALHDILAGTICIRKKKLSAV